MSERTQIVAALTEEIAPFTLERLNPEDLAEAIVHAIEQVMEAAAEEVSDHTEGGCYEIREVAPPTTGMRHSVVQVWDDGDGERSIAIAGFYNSDTAQVLVDALNPTPEPPAVEGPVPMTLSCPKCNLRHEDKGEWATRSHKTHLCEECGHEWRPFPYPTVGIPTPTQEQTLREAAQRLMDVLSEGYTGGATWEGTNIDDEMQRLMVALGRADVEAKAWEELREAASGLLEAESYGVANKTWDRLIAAVAALPAAKGGA